MSEAPLIAEFTLSEGGPVSVNLSNLDYFKPTSEGTVIVLSDGVEIIGVDEYDAVAERLNPERQAGS